MKNTFEIYPNRGKSFELGNKKLEEARISQNNKDLIRNFQNYISSTGSGKERIAKLTYELRKLAIVLKTDFDTATKQDVLMVVAHFNQQEKLSEATKSDYRRTLKQFYKWFKEDDKRLDSEDKLIRKDAEKFYNYLEKEVSISYKKRQIDPTTILSEEEIEIVISKGCRTPKEKAFIKLLHETGLRAGEILNLRIKDIILKKNFASLCVDGKTGRRQVQIAKSLGYLTKWLDVHSLKDNPESFVWLGESSNRRNEPLIHRGAQKLVDRCFERANLDKKHNLHWFRHSRASLLAPKLPEALLCRYLGWTLGSRQVKTYCHLCPQEIEDAFLRINGLAGKEEEKSLPLICGCGEINDNFARYCYKCGNPLSVETALQDKEIIKTETGKAIKEMMELFKDKEMMQKFLDFKNKI